MHDEETKDFAPQASCHTCGDRASITLFDVTNRFTGLVERGAASEFSGVDKVGNSNAVARDHYQVQRSIGYCSSCYQGAAKSTGQPADPKTAAAWIWLIGQWDTPDLSDPACDEYLEICNRQAFANRNPDAIPPHCHLPHVWGAA